MANINDVINGLKTKYNITDSTTEQELLELLNVVTVDELNAIKATSVIPLPNVVKGSPQELKERFVKIVSDEQRGVANVINTRMGLLRIFLAAYMEYVNNTYVIVDEIVDNLNTENAKKALSANQGKVLKGMIDDRIKYSDIIDLLTSDDATKPLSAKQGKVLKDLIDTLTVGNDRLVDGSVSESKLASNSVSETKIKAGAITTDKLADDSVSNDKVKVNAIHTRNIKNGDITFDKLAQEVINYIDGIASGNSIYRGNYESVEDLPTGALIHNNDYAYVTVEVEDEETGEVNPELARYKFSEGEWAFEYIIPNTSFSADEWEAIKSGITSTLVNKLKGIETGAQVNTQSDWNESDNTKDEYIKNKPNVVTTDTAQEISQDKTFNGAKIKFKNSAIDIWDIRKNGSTLEINRDNTVMMQLLTNIIKLKSLIPLSDDESLGNSGSKWKDIWFSGSLKDGTNELSLAQLKNAYDKALSAVQDNNYTHTDNNYTTTEKEKLAGLSNYDDTQVRGLITTETSRATSQEQKALYHLGAYDSIASETSDTITITKRTIHINTKNLLDHLFMNDYWASQDKYVFGININEIASVDQYNPMNYKDYVDNGCFPTPAYDNNYVVLMSTSTSSLPDNYLFWGRVSKQICFRKKEITTLAAMKAYLSSLGTISIQFQAENVLYTETFIKDQPLNTLDGNMSSKIRQKVVDGLQLFGAYAWNFSGASSVTVTSTTQYGYVATVNDLNSRDVFKLVDVKPNTTYTVSFYHSNSIYFRASGTGGTATGNQAFDGSGNGTYTFTTGNDAQISLYFIPNATGSLTMSSIVFNEGNHSYSYSFFNQKEHITNNEATLLKSEYKKSSNLCYALYQSSSGLKAAAFSFYAEPNTTYSFRTAISVTNSSVRLQTLAGTLVEEYSSLSGTNNINGFTFTTGNITAGNYELATFFTSNTSYQGGISVAKPMLVKGNTTEPYYERCGDILHKVDIEPFLLWTNPNPNQAFNATYQVIFNINNAHEKYKYLVFEIKHYIGSSNTETQFVKIPSTIGNPYKEDIYFVHAGYIAVRQVGMYGTQNYIGDCYVGEAKTQNNEACIPVRIYGTNTL